MIHFENVTKQFGKVTAIRNMSFDITAGKTTALIGGNGSGKTTMLRMISTILSPTSGKIAVEGIDSRKNPAEIRKKIGFMIGGDASLIRHLTARENILFFAVMQGVDEKTASQRIERLSSELNMTSYMDLPVDGFSRGMRQKVIFAQSIIHDPSILLLDEPSTGLDIHAICDVQTFIRLCQSEKKTIVLSSHNMNEIEKLSEEVLIIHHGELLYHDTVAALKSTYRTDSIEAAFSAMTRELLI